MSAWLRRIITRVAPWTPPVVISIAAFCSYVQYRNVREMAQLTAKVLVQAKQCQQLLDECRASSVRR